MNLVEKMAELVRNESDEAVQTALGWLQGENRNRRDRRDRILVAALKAGDKVVVKAEHGTRRLPAGTVGTIIRFGQKKLLVDFGAFLTWRVPPSFVEKAAGGLVPKGDEIFAPAFALPSPATRRRRRHQYEETPPDQA